MPRHRGPRRCSTKAEPVRIPSAEEKGGGTWPGLLPKEKPPGTGQPTPGVKATLRAVSASALGPATALSPQPGWQAGRALQPLESHPARRGGGGSLF